MPTPTTRMPAFITDDPLVANITETTQYPQTIQEEPTRDIRSNPIYEEYIREMDEYIRDLPMDGLLRTFTFDHQMRLESREENIRLLLNGLGVFRDIRRMFGSSVATLTVNNRYDTRNLTQRFILLHLRDVYDIVNINSIIANRPIGRECYDVPSRVLNVTDIAFLTVHSVRQDEDIEIMRANRPPIPDTLDFTINGQKLKVGLHVRLDRESRTRYVNTIALYVTSERGSNARNIAWLERVDKLVFKRLPLSRPIHGLKFVRRRDPGNGELLVKELH